MIRIPAQSTTLSSLSSSSSMSSRSRRLMLLRRRRSPVPVAGTASMFWQQQQQQQQQRYLSTTLSFQTKKNEQRLFFRTTFGRTWEKRSFVTTTTTTVPSTTRGGLLPSVSVSHYDDNVLNNHNNNNNQRTTTAAAAASMPFLQQSWWWWSGAKLPKGFEDFFPENARSKPPTDAEKGAAAAKSSEKDKDKESTKVESSGGGGSNDDKNQKKKKESSTPPPPGLDDNGNLPGLLALLALIVTLRHWLEQEEREMGQEITWQYFRNHFLWPGKVEGLQVVNRNVARVILKSDAVTTAAAAAAGANSGALVGLPVTSGGSGADDGTVLEFDHGSSTSTSTTTPSHAHQHHNPHHHYYFYIGSVESFEEKLTRAQQHIHPAEWVEVNYVNRTNWALEAIKLLPFVAFVAAVHFGIRGGASARGFGGSGSGGSGGGMSSLFSMGRSTARKIRKEDIKVTFKDVAGCQQAKMEIMEFVDFLKDSERFTKLGAKIPKGALLCGPPGTGKTLLAKAVAGESGVPFYSISGSDFIEMFVGVGPSRVRDLFKEARANAPCIVFIDEIDAVGRQRGRGGFSGGGNDERENTLNQLLVEMDGFSPTTGVVVLAGTNRVDILDQALTRPGRFDRQITVDRPDLQGRKEIFEVHLQGIKLAGPMSDYAGRLAGLTPGFAGADIANICNEAAIVAARRKADAVTMVDFEKATDRIIGGLESNKIMSKEERSIVAHHEAGHAIAGWFLEHADPLLKVTIIPRASGALGFAQYLPKEVFLRSQEQIMDIVCMALAGRAAEEVFFGRVTTGASDDLRRVTQLVYSMIKDFGMNRRLGQLSFPRNSNDNGGFGGGEKRYSDSTAEAMDDEARSIVDAAYKRTVDLIREKKTDVEKVAQLLLDRETITHDDIVDLVGERPFAADTAYQQYVTNTRHGEPKKEEEELVLEKPDAEGGGTTFTPGLA